MVEAIKRAIGNDDDVDAPVVVVVVTVVFLSEGVMVLALKIAKDTVDCVSIVEVISEPVCEVISGVVLVVAMDLDVGIVEDVKIVERESSVFFDVFP